LQAALAVLTLVGGCLTALVANDWRWAAGGIAVGGAIPLTLAVIMPVNNKLLEPKSLSFEEAGQLLRRWGRLHVYRTALGVLGLMILVVAAVR
jgi:hypothetical protein